VTVELGDLRSALLETLAEPLAAIGLDPESVPDDLDLLAAGVIDSFGLLELIAALEDRFRTTLDFADLAAEDLTVVGPLTRHLLAQIQAVSA
jgi:acyl carrier protein